MKFFKNRKILIVVAVVVGLVAVLSFSYARYIYNAIWDYYLVSKGFYFESDDLSSNGSRKVIGTWDGGSVSFNIKNNLSKSQITDADITYTAVCTVKGDEAAHATCTINGDGNTKTGVLSNSKVCINNTEDGKDVSSYNKTNCELEGYTWEHQQVLEELYFDVVLTDEDYELKDVTVGINVTSNAPYKRTLTGDFALSKAGVTTDDNLTMTYNSYENHNRLVVSNSYNTAKCVKIVWDPENLVIDGEPDGFATYQVDANDYISEIEFNIEGRDSLSFVFYEINYNTGASVDSFTLSEGTNCN